MNDCHDCMDSGPSLADIDTAEGAVKLVSVRGRSVLGMCSILICGSGQDETACCGNVGTL